MIDLRTSAASPRLSDTGHFVVTMSCFLEKLKLIYVSVTYDVRSNKVCDRVHRLDHKTRTPNDLLASTEALQAHRRSNAQPLYARRKAVPLAHVAGKGATLPDALVVGNDLSGLEQWWYVASWSHH